jgi:hypothetical protein
MVYSARSTVDLYGGRSATSHEEVVKLMQFLDRKATDKILQAGLDHLEFGSISAYPDNLSRNARVQSAIVVR